VQQHVFRVARLGFEQLTISIHSPPSPTTTHFCGKQPQHRKGKKEKKKKKKKKNLLSEARDEIGVGDVQSTA
jgi:hypothetical protein